MKDYSEPGSRCAKAWKDKQDKLKADQVEAIFKSARSARLLAEAFEQLIEQKKPWYRRLF